MRPPEANGVGSAHRCAEERVTRAELFESLSVGLVVGGSIVIPRLRRAVDRWSGLERLAR